MDATPSTGGSTSTTLAAHRVTSGNFLEMFEFFLLGFYAMPMSIW